MKQITMKQFLFMASALLFTVPSWAQGAGGLVAGGKGIVEGTAAATKAAQEASRLTQFGDAVTSAALMTAPAINAQVQRAVTQGARFNFSTDVTPAKKLLNLNTQYWQERTQAATLLSNLKAIQAPLTGQQELKLATEIEKTAHNKSLKEFLHAAVMEKNYPLALREVADYYGLSTEFINSLELRFVHPSDAREVFVHTTLDYIQRHPHKVSLQLREILKNPAMDPQLVALIKMYVNLPSIGRAQEMRFTTLLRAAYDQHVEILTATRNSQEIQETIAIYKDLLQRLRGFLAQYDRTPRWNGLPAERELYNDILILMGNNRFNMFREVTPTIEIIQDLLDANPPQYYSKEETLELLEGFYVRHGFAPRTAQEAEDVTEEELFLGNSIFHWMIEDSHFAGAIEDMHRKYRQK